MLIWSCLLKELFPEENINIHDIDYAISEWNFFVEKDTITGKKIEYHPIPCLFKEEYSNCNKLDVLYTLKLSHSIRDIKYDKTILDIDFMIWKGAKKIPNLLKDLLDYWDVIHWKRKTAYFMKENENFFEDKVKRLMPHDDLHYLMKLNDVEMYKIAKKNDSLAIINMEMFFNLTKEQQLDMIKEEVGVIALERYMFSWITKNIESAIPKAMKDLIIRMFWPITAMFVVENYREIRKSKKMREKMKEIFEKYAN